MLARVRREQEGKKQLSIKDTLKFRREKDGEEEDRKRCPLDVEDSHFLVPESKQGFVETPEKNCAPARARGRKIALEDDAKGWLANQKSRWFVQKFTPAPAPVITACNLQVLGVRQDDEARLWLWVPG